MESSGRMMLLIASARLAAAGPIGNESQALAT